MAQTSRFFEQLRDHTEIKLRLLSKFLVPWSAKLGYKVRLRGGERIWYVDGFAGPGKYDDDSPGSPLIGAGQALAVLRKNAGYVLACVNVEQEPSRFRSLEHVTERYKEWGVPMYNLHGDFSALVPQISTIVGPADPLLVFIDPFGIKPLVYASLRALISRPGEVDLILIFQTPAVHRLVRTHPGYVTRAVGGDDWVAQWDVVGAEAVYDTFARNLLLDGKFRAVAPYGVRARKESAPKYHMLVASRTPDAFELLNDMICQEEKQLDRKTYTDLAQLTFLPQLNGLTSQHELVNAILSYGRTHPRTSRREILEHMVLTYWAAWHTGDVKRAVGGLIDGGRIVRHKRERGNIDTDPLDFRL
jgi:three-Cys-motif partner protein